MASVQLVGTGLLLLLLLLFTCRPCEGDYIIHDGRHEGCGWTTRAWTGTVQSPNFPSNYPNSQDCVYIIKTSVGYQIMLTFTDFDLEADRDCVEIRDGDATSHLIGRYCDTSLPHGAVTFSNQLWIRFVSDSNGTRRGFNATFASVSGQRTWDWSEAWDSSWFIMAMTGIFRSPNFPSNYNNSQDFLYVIKVPLGYWITLNFTDFDLESQWKCSKDFVEIRDGDFSSPLIGRYCNTLLPPPTRSSGNQMWIRFVSDSSETRRGFRATFAAGCGWNTTELTGTIQSPNFTSVYIHSQECVYIIKAPVRHRVTLTFTDFDLEPGTDSIEIRDGNATSRLIGHYDSTLLPHVVRTSGSQMWIRFVTDTSVSRRGFRATFASIFGCSTYITSLSGTVQSPNFPSTYSNSQDCIYVIKAPVGHQVTLTFTDFDLQFDSKCLLDFVEIRDGNATSPLIGHYCGTSLPPPATTSGNQMWIRFVSDSSVTRGGFRATFVSVSASSTPISSPRSPLNSSVVVTSTDPQPFDTNGNQMTLTCDHGLIVDVISYVWNVPCTTQAGRTCIFKPRPTEDDGQVARCTVTSWDGEVAAGELMIHLNFVSTGSSENITAIAVGCAVAGAVVITIVIICVVCIARRRRAKYKTPCTERGNHGQEKPSG